MFTKSIIALAALGGASVSAQAQSSASSLPASATSAASAAASAYSAGATGNEISTAAGSNQVKSIVTYGLSLLSPSCQAAVTQLARNGSEVSTCLHADLLTQVVLSNSSIIPPVGNYLETFCSSAPCSNETLTNATTSLLEGCTSDLTNFGVTNQTVEWAIAQYPLARDVLCLKTSEPFSSNATSSANSTTTATNATSPSASNSTSNGTFCATSLLTELSSYLGTDLTVSDIIRTALGGNSTAIQTLKSIPPSALCNDCVFAAISLVEEQYPSLGNLSIGNTTFNDFIEGSCSLANSTSSSNSTSSALPTEEYQISSNGTLPDTITESAFNSSLTNSTSTLNSTIPQTNVSLPTQLLSTAASLATEFRSSTSALAATAASEPSNNARALKMRWIGA